MVVAATTVVQSALRIMVIIRVGVTTNNIKTVLSYCLVLKQIINETYKNLLFKQTLGDRYERRGGDDWNRGYPRGGGSRDGDRPDPPIRTNDRWQEPEKPRENTNYGKWKDDGGRGYKGLNTFSHWLVFGVKNYVTSFLRTLSF